MYTVNKGPSKFVTKTRPGLIAASHLDATTLSLRPFRRTDSTDHSPNSPNGDTTTATTTTTTSSSSAPSSTPSTPLLFNERLAGPRPVFHTTVRKQQPHHHQQQHHRNHNGTHHPHQQPLGNNGSHAYHQRHPYHNGGSNNSVGALPQHEEIVQFIQESWTSLVPAVELESATVTVLSPQIAAAAAATSRNTSRTTPSVVFYAESPNAALADFGSFDLETWWGRRLFHSITKNA